MQLPSIQNKPSYIRRVTSAAHLLKFFGRKTVSVLEADDMERYREFRRSQSAAHGTIDLEIGFFRSMYHLARKRKKIHADDMPGEFV